MDEKALIRRAQQQDHGAFDTLLKRYRRLIFTALHRSGCSPQEQEALFWELSAHLYRKVPRYRADKAPFATWMYRVLKNFLIDKQRSHAREPEHKLLSEHLEELQTTQDPFQELQLLELRSQLQGALVELPKLERKVFLLKYAHGLSYEEIAHKVDASTNQVSYLLTKALRRLRLSLQGAWQEWKPRSLLQRRA